MTTQSGKTTIRLLLCLTLTALFTLPPGVPLKAQDQVREEADLRIPMRDDIMLSADVYRPDTDGSFPTLYVATPYPRAAGQPWRDEALLRHYVRQGYAVILVNVRGTGESGGEYAFLSRDEQQDHYETMAWIRDQDWSNGRIGGFGSGYAATAQWLAALQQPPGLSCIAPVDGVLSPYHDWAFPGGVGSEAFLDDWYEGRLRIPHAFPAAGTPRLLPLDMQLKMLEHGRFDSWWQERDARQRLDQLAVPVYMIHHWDPQSPGTASTLQATRQLGVQHRTLILNPDSPDFSDPGFHDRELLPFYDWCLKDQDTRFIERPELRFEVPGRTLEKRSSRWPPGDITFTPLFPDQARSHLGFENPGAGRSLTLSAEETLRFSSGRLEAPLDLSGPLMMSLGVATDDRDLALQVRLLERRWRGELPTAGGDPDLPDFLDPEAEPVPAEAMAPQLISRGVLKLSARAEDDTPDSDYQPRYSGTETSPVEAGRHYDLRIAMQPVARRFQPGSELILELRQVQDASLRQLQPSARISMAESRRPRLWLPMTRGRNAITAPATPEETGTDPAGGMADLLFNNDNPIIPLPAGGAE